MLRKFFLSEGCGLTSSMSPRPAAKSIVRLIGLAVVLLLLFSATLAHAGRYILDKKDDREENYQFSDVDGVCAAYEKNLARFGDRPYGMSCGRELDPALGFTRPTWTKLDMVAHADLVRDILRYLRWEDGIKNDPRPWIEQVKGMVAHGTILELTRVDADEDGKPDNLLRFGDVRPCKPEQEFMGPISARRMVVADEALTKVLRTPLITTEGDVILYRGKTYSDRLYGEKVRRKGRNGALHLFEFTKHGTARMCRFRYIDPTLNAPHSNGGVRP